MSRPGPDEPTEALVKRQVELTEQMSEMVQETRSIQKAIPSIVQQTAGLLTPHSPTHLSSAGSPPRDQPVICPHPSNLAKLRAFMRNQCAQFTCPKQAQALEAVLANSEHVFLLGPTGMGKTSVFLIPAMESPHKVTIILIPLSALRIDFMRRYGKLGITCSEWFEGSKPTTTIVMVSPENAATKSFLSWAIGMKNMDLVLRLVYDEPHLSKMHESFCLCFSSHRRLIETGKCLYPYRDSWSSLSTSQGFCSF